MNVSRVMTVMSLSFLCLLSACGDTQAEQQLIRGKEIVQQNCKVCHAQGINGAPMIGNQKMWGPRIVKGHAALVTNAVNGFGLMPPKGGKTHLTDAEIGLAVGYFLSQLEENQEK